MKTTVYIDNALVKCGKGHHMMRVNTNSNYGSATATVYTCAVTECDQYGKAVIVPMRAVKCDTLGTCLLETGGTFRL